MIAVKTIKSVTTRGRKIYTKQINIKNKTNEESIRKTLDNNNIHGNRGQLVNGECAWYST